MESRGGLTGGDQARTQWVINEWGRIPAHVLPGLCRAVSSVDVAPLLSQIRVPTFILAPANSAYEPLNAQVAMHDAIPSARIAVIHGMGHEIYADRADACAAAVLNFMESLHTQR